MEEVWPTVKGAKSGSYCWFLSRADDQLGPSTFLNHRSGLRVKNFSSKHWLEHHRMLLTFRGLETHSSTGLRLETLGTLALVLFPENDAASRKWYRKQGERGENDMMILRCGLGHRKTRPEEYPYSQRGIRRVSGDEVVGRKQFGVGMKLKMEDGIGRRQKSGDNQRGPRIPMVG